MGALHFWFNTLLVLLYTEMSKQQISGSKQGKIRLYDYERIISRTFALMQKELSENNYILIKKFDMVLVNESLSLAIIMTMLMISRILLRYTSSRHTKVFNRFLHGQFGLVILMIGLIALHVLTGDD